MEEPVNETHSQPAPSDDKKRQEQAFWHRYFRFYDTLNEAIPYQEMIARHVDLIAAGPGDLVLDAGTGTGNVAQALLARGSRVVGIDFLEPALDICRRKMPGTQFQFGDLSGRLAFPDAHFDKLTSCNVLYILAPEAQKNAARELYRTLKPGGLASITVFGSGFRALAVYFEALRARSRRSGALETALFGLRYSYNTLRILLNVSQIKKRQKGGDYTFFTPDLLRALLAGAGFEVLSVEPVFADQCLIALARKPAAHHKG
jgi:ubiquinone/menaquinone biosynthesis C-methylase UbiE